MYIHVRVKAGSKEEKIEKKSSTQYVLSVRELAERNMANKRVIEIMRKETGFNNVRIISGAHSPSKLLSLD